MKYDEKKIEQIEDFFKKFDLIKEILGLLFTYIFGAFLIYVFIFLNSNIVSKLLGIIIFIVVAVVETAMFISKYIRRKK
jgi:uncharacterized protein YacL